MDPNFSRYIWRHTRTQQIWILCIAVLSMLPYYLALDLPKLILNGPILGTGFESYAATQTFAPYTLTLPWIGEVNLIGGMQFDRLKTLLGLSMAFLALVIINGLFKYYINIYKGLLGERLLRRIRFELVDRILRFQPASFKHVKGGEVASMVKDEVEPLGGFTGDAFVQPVLLGGQALTALFFIFVQHFWLGMIALLMVAVQFGIIPPLRRRLIELGRERQLQARHLAGRVTEIVDGMNAVRANDTSNYERADIAHRLARIFHVRYQIYKRKFLVKFLNNFLAQLTPFLFYVFGGYLTIKGDVDVGQLVAVINAYKELPGPLKELIDWDLTRQDVQVKYEQVVEQFQTADMAEAAMHRTDASYAPRLRLPLIISNLTVEDDSGAKRLDHVSLRVDPGEVVAVVGDATSGADAVAEALARLAVPVGGRVLLGDHDLNTLPESIAGRRITYASSETYFFSGSLRDNLAYGLKHAPLAEPDLVGKAAAARRRISLEARKSGNPDLAFTADWIDPAAVTAHGDVGLAGAMMAVLDVVGLTDQVVDFAMFTTLDVKAYPDLAGQILILRAAFRAELDRIDRANLVVPFRARSYNTEGRVIDNLLFGVFTDVKDQMGRAEGGAYFARILADSGLQTILYRMGMRIAENTVELFDDLPPDHPFFQRLTYMEPEDVPRIKALIPKLKNTPFARVKEEDRQTMIGLAFQYVEPQYRFGLLDAEVMEMIVAVRDFFHAGLPLHLRPLIERYDPDRYLVAGNLIDNIVFGKINQKFSDADRQIREVLLGLLRAQPALYAQVFAMGLEYHLGAAGRRLTVQQRQKLNFARALLRRSDVYVFNRALSALDAATQDQIVRATLEFLRRQGDDPAVIWVLVSKAYAGYFQRVITFGNGSVLTDETVT